MITFASLFKQQIIQLDLSYSWAFGARWSPSGNTLAYVGQNFPNPCFQELLLHTRIFAESLLPHRLLIFPIRLCRIGHSSMIYFVDDVGPSPLAQSVAFRDLPLRDVGQHPFLLFSYSNFFSHLLLTL